MSTSFRYMKSLRYVGALLFHLGLNTGCSWLLSSPLPSEITLSSRWYVAWSRSQSSYDVSSGDNPSHCTRTCNLESLKSKFLWVPTIASGVIKLMGQHCHSKEVDKMVWAWSNETWDKYGHPRVVEVYKQLDQFYLVSWRAYKIF